MILLFILILLACLLCYPYGAAYFARRGMLKRLERLAADCGLRMRRLRKPMLLARNRGERYDLLLENRERVYAVKLWSAYRRGLTLVITREGRVMERAFSEAPMDVRRGAGPVHREGRRLSVRRTLSPLSRGDRRPVTAILLIWPTYRTVVRQTDGGEVRLTGGETVFEKRLCSPADLERLLRSESEKTAAPAQN